MQSNFFSPKLNKRNIKFIKTFTALALIISVSLKAQTMSLFLSATRSGWYPEFLNPVVDVIASQGTSSSVLDIGTGPGTLPQMLIERNQDWVVTGIDIDTAMITEARKRFSHSHVSFQVQKINTPLPFADGQFDVVTFCSVLFLLDDSVRKQLMDEAVRVLKPNGKVIILTPSGDKWVGSSFVEVWSYPFSVNNFTFPLWKVATTRRARKWRKEKWAEKYSAGHPLKYTGFTVFRDNARIEIISKQ